MAQLKEIFDLYDLEADVSEVYLALRFRTILSGKYALFDNSVCHIAGLYQVS
jgi:hypothetical protein